MMTRSSYERSMLSIFRMAMSPFGRILVVSLTIPVVKMLGNNQSAWAKAMALWSIVAFAMLMICFRSCEEHVDIPGMHKVGRVTIRKNLGALASNQYFWSTLVLWTLTCVHLTVSGTVTPYYCKYIFGNDTWMYSYLYLGETGLLVLGALLAHSGYISSMTGGAVQPESAKQMIMNIYLYGTLCIWVLAAVVLYFYRLDMIFPKIMADLQEREESGEM